MRSPLPRYAAFALIFAALGMTPAAAQTGPVPLDKHRVRAWSGPDAPTGTIEDLALTPDGYLWVATGDGLFRFDGARFTRYGTATDTALLSDNVIALAAGPEGDLWVGTAAGLLRRAPDGPLTRVELPEVIRPQIQTLLWDGPGLWVGTADDGLVLIGGEEVTRYTVADGLPQGMLRALVPARGGGVWIGTAGGGVARVRADGIDRHTLPGEDVRDIVEDDDGLWVATRAGLARVGRGGTEWSRNGVMGGALVTRLLPDGRGGLWVATSGTGLFRRHANGVLEQLPTAEGQSPLDVRALATDDRGTLLVGTVGAGLLSVFAGDVLPLTTAHGLPHPVALAALPASNGGLWVGTFGGGLARVGPEGRVTAVVDTSLGLPDQAVLTLAESRDTLWVGTRRGLAKVQVGNLAVSTEAAFDGVGVTALAVDRSERLWIGTVEGIFVRSRNGLRRITARDGLSADFIFAMTQSRSGDMLIATQGGGLNRLRPDGGIDTVSTADGLPSNVVLHLYEDSSQTVWVGTHAGLSRIRDGSVATLTVRHGLPDDAVFGMADDGHGRAILTSNRGIALISWDALNAAADGDSTTLDPLVLTAAHGMPSTEANGGVQPSIARTDDGRFWIPTMKGVAALNTSEMSMNVPRRTRVEAVDVGVKRLSPDTAVDLPPNPHRLSIAYTAADFQSPEALGFRYRLDGYDDDWTLAGVERYVHYTGLPPGEYTFRVQARSGTGEWGESAELPVDVAAAFHQTVPFRILLVLLLVGSVVLLHKLRVRALRERERSLLALIDARDRAEQERIEAEEQLRASHKREAMGRLAGGVAHDFNNLLTTMFGHTDLLRERCVHDAVALGEIDELRGTAERATALTRQLLSLSRKREWAPGLLNVDGVVRGMESLLRRTLGERVVLTTALNASGAVVRADRGQLEQVLLNLAINARDAMDGGGTITIGTRTAPPAATSGAEGQRLELYVADTGTGIDEATRAHLFEPFFTTKDEGRGTGLGLSIVAGIVERHGGTIDVESRLGAGSVFRIRLPIMAEGSTEVKEDAFAEQYEPFETGRVLLVEDEASVRSLARRLLETRGFEVIEASSGEEALRAWERGRAGVDLLITDLGLPSMDGRALAVRLRADRADLPILFMSGYPEDEVDLGDLAEPSGFIAKPFDLERLSGTVHRILERRQPASPQPLRART